MEKFKLKRIWVEESLLKGVAIRIISKEKVHHLNVVLRIRLGESVRLFNQTDGEWTGRVLEKDNRVVVIEIVEQLRAPESEHMLGKVTIAFAPIKLDRLRFLIEKCTEIGADEFIPVITERTVVRGIKSSKLHAYTVGAAEQSERLSVPRFQEPVSLENFLKTQTTSSVLFCNERSDCGFISKAMLKLSNNSQIIILIGPEGGFTPKEQAKLTFYKNVHSISLGDNVLRSETAAIFALSCVKLCRAGRNNGAVEKT